MGASSTVLPNSFALVASCWKNHALGQTNCAMAIKLVAALLLLLLNYELSLKLVAAILLLLLE